MVCPKRAAYSVPNRCPQHVSRRCTQMCPVCAPKMYSVFCYYLFTDTFFRHTMCTLFGFCGHTLQTDTPEDFAGTPRHAMRNNRLASGIWLVASGPTGLVAGLHASLITAKGPTPYWPPGKPTPYCSTGSFATPGSPHAIPGPHGINQVGL